MKKCLFLFLFLTNSLVEAATLNFSFYQGGFQEGAFVKGEFQGNDINQDGVLSYSSGEVSYFTMGFSGNFLMPAFGLETSSLIELEYYFNDNVLGILAGDTAIFDFGYAYDGFGGRLPDHGPIYEGLVHYGELVFGPDGTTFYFETQSYTFEPETVAVNNIPIPASFWLFVSSFALVFSKRKF